MAAKRKTYMTLQTIIEAACAEAVREAEGNKTLAAERLNINRVTLRKYLRGGTNRLKSNQLKKRKAGDGNGKRDI